VVEGPIRAIEQPINLARHDEVVLMQSFDLLGAQRDSSIAPAEADVRVMAFWLGKLTNFHEEAHSMDDACTNWAEEFFSRMRSAEIGIHHHIAGAYLLRYAQERSWRGGQPPSVER
jgi:ISXO2-like transposase domain